MTEINLGTAMLQNKSVSKDMTGYKGQLQQVETYGSKVCLVKLFVRSPIKQWHQSPSLLISFLQFDYVFNVY